MFIIVPLLLIIGSLAGIAIIINRKLPYLKKLTPEAHEPSGNIVQEFFPELLTWLNSMKFKDYKQLSLIELEKLLRRLRVVSLKIDYMSDSLIKKIRRVNLANNLERAVMDSRTLSQSAEPVPTAKPSEEIKTDELKAQEQKLIIDIAKNPKDPQLYEALGDLYLKLNSAQDAKESYEAALELSPSDIALARKYSRLLKRTEVAA